MRINPKHAVNEGTLAFYRGRWSGNCKKVIQQFGGSNFWGPNRNRCTIIKPEQIEWLLASGIAERVAGGIKFLVNAK